MLKGTTINLRPDGMIDVVETHVRTATPDEIEAAQYLRKRPAAMLASAFGGNGPVQLHIAISDLSDEQIREALHHKEVLCERCDKRGVCRWSTPHSAWICPTCSADNFTPTAIITG
jgi:hypothetical protein